MQQNPPGPEVSAGQEPMMEVDGVKYILIPQNVNISLNVESSSPVPFLLYALQPGQVVTADALQAFYTDKLEPDDVYQRGFASRLVFYGPESCPRLKHAFQAGLDCPTSGTGGRVIVPSRCYYTISRSRPLNGIRIGVEDSIDIAGHKTTLDNGRVLPGLLPAATHARCLQLLLRAGAIIVGKLRHVAFTYLEEPAVSLTDHFDHRDDRPQVPRVYGSGSAAAICSYDWLDLSLGSDSKWAFISPPEANTSFANSYIERGTLPIPAVYNGCHTMRPTPGTVKAEGVITQFPDFGMPGFFGRDVSQISKMISVSSGPACPLRETFGVPAEILYPSDYLSTANEDQTRATNQFIYGLEISFNTRRSVISIANQWEEDMPDGIENRDISVYLKTAGIYPFIRESEKASEALGGDARAESSPSSPKPALKVHAKSQIIKCISEEKRAEWARRCEVYRNWLLSRIFEAHSKEKLRFMAFPVVGGKPNYGNEPEPLDDLLNGYASTNMSPILQAPELSVVVGKFSCLHPFSISVVGPPGTDALLIKLVQRGMKAVARRQTQSSVN